jgi:hypothetical protein
LKLKLAAAFAALGVASTVLAGCSTAPAAGGTSATMSTVLYEVEGSTTSADITIETGSGTSQKSVAVPMGSPSDRTKGLTLKIPSGHFLYISAQNKKASGTVICRITVDGVQVSENSAQGAYAIATCKA